MSNPVIPIIYDLAITLIAIIAIFYVANREKRKAHKTIIALGELLDEDKEIIKQLQEAGSSIERMMKLTGCKSTEQLEEWVHQAYCFDKSGGTTILEFIRAQHSF